MTARGQFLHLEVERIGLVTTETVEKVRATKEHKRLE